MVHPSHSVPTYEQILKDIADSLTGPLPLDDLIQQVLTRKHSSAKNPRASVLNVLRYSLGKSVVYLDPKTVLPTRLAMQGARFRLPLGRRVAEKGELEMAWFESYLPFGFPLEKTRFVDAKGKPIPAPLKSMRQTVNTILAPYEKTLLLADLSGWLRPQKVTRRDDLLVTIQDWQSGVFQLEVESHKKRDPALLQARDRLLADLFYTMLEGATAERLWVLEAIPTVYARLPEKDGYPPHHWIIVLAQDGRLRFNGIEISYADGPLSPFEEMILEQLGQGRPLRLQPVSQKQKKLVYRFKAALKYNPRIWREVEILGGQTLDDLNRALVSAFNHDFDHLAGFWKLVPRLGGRKVRYREVDLGTVDPLGGGDGAAVRIAAIGLKEGDRLKYVFDFGDWIEHTLTLEAIQPAEEGVKYPREVARNKPRYVYCADCEKKGKKTIAKWQCISCSDKQQADMFYCDQCLVKFHEDHYTLEIIY
jgi:hypothetical protein